MLGHISIDEFICCGQTVSVITNLFTHSAETINKHQISPFTHDLSPRTTPMKTLQQNRVAHYHKRSSQQPITRSTWRTLFDPGLSLLLYGLMLFLLNALSTPLWVLLLESSFAVGVLIENNKLFTQSCTVKRLQQRLHWAISMLIAALNTLILLWAAALGEIAQAPGLCLFLGFCLAMGIGLTMGISIQLVIQILKRLIYIANSRKQSNERYPKNRYKSVAFLAHCLRISIWSLIWDAMRGVCIESI